MKFIEVVNMAEEYFLREVEWRLVFARKSSNDYSINFQNWADSLLNSEAYMRRNSYFKKNALLLFSNSFYFLCFFNEVVKRQIIKDKKIGKIKENKDKISEYIDFYNNLILSKFLSFFYLRNRHIINKSVNFPQHNLVVNIFELGCWFYENFTKSTWRRRNGQDFSIILTEYCCYMQLYYSLIQNYQTESCVFLHFDFNSQQFDKIYNYLNQSLKDMEQADDLSQILNIFATAILEKKKESDEIYKLKNWVFGAKNKIEPLTWHLFDFLDYLNLMKPKDFSQKNLLMNFVQDSLDLYDKIYKGEKILFEELFWLESNFIDLWKNPLWKPPEYWFSDQYK
jgi:hypothetical protein